MSTKHSVLTGTALVAGLAAIALTTQGCASLGDKLGMNYQAPDEFKVVAMAPLVVPPDYSLRPPAPGEPRPQELQPESAARLALVGQQEATQRSQGETLLVDRAGGQKADPLIRYMVDDQFGSIAHKDKSFADMVMFWKKGEPATVTPAQASGALTPAPLDPVAEQAKIKSLTGGKPVLIARAPAKKGFKLPGL
jgi:hypothetical protein